MINLEFYVSIRVAGWRVAEIELAERRKMCVELRREI